MHLDRTGRLETREEFGTGSATGIALMTAIAYYISWSRRQDEHKAGAARSRVARAHERPIAGSVRSEAPAE